LKKRSILYSFSVDDNKESLSKTEHFLWLINQWNHSEPETLKAMNALLNFFGNVRGLNRREIGEFQALSGIVQSFNHASSFKEVAQIYCSMYEKVGQNQDADEADKLELLTLHSSKGLQWPSVWIMSVNEEVLPSANNSNIEEERRLLFVGMTRAEEKLVISYQDDKKSLFIDEL
jgi:superfamily I DNA/RNA helicase